MWYLCKEIFKTTPDDPRIVDMDPVQKMWMYENWVADQMDVAELARNHAYLMGSFWNPEAVKQLVGGDKHISTEEDFDESSRMVREMNLKAMKEHKVKPKRRRGTLKG